ncbi:Arf-GAP with Rho-GAP domain, ANK repeat and PH domain-containing protein 2 [Ameca splendens]|uniref:Arf-GAP with Rho-GAP domain, ANK repeat and PH domain-containing protein 2 n=1 Tax=Ameca splendens TaxID=208324 RepID=A0ABV0YDP5_9TELE
MELVFNGADVMCATGDPDYSTPYVLAQRAGQKLQMEFLHQNKLSDFPRLDQCSENPSLSDASFFMDGFLYVSSGPVKMMPDRRGRDDSSAASVAAPPACAMFPHLQTAGTFLGPMGN